MAFCMQVLSQQGERQRGLLQRLAAQHLAGFVLQPGNPVVLPLMGQDVVFRVRSCACDFICEMMPSHSGRRHAPVTPLHVASAAATAAAVHASVPRDTIKSASHHDACRISHEASCRFSPWTVNGQAVTAARMTSRSTVLLVPATDPAVDGEAQPTAVHHVRSQHRPISCPNLVVPLL